MLNRWYMDRIALLVGYSVAILLCSGALLLTPVTCSTHLSQQYYDEIAIRPDAVPLTRGVPAGYPTDHIYEYKEGYMAQKKAPEHLDILDGRLDGLYIYPAPFRNVTVYIVDHGVDIHHPDISGIASMDYNPYMVTRKSMEHGTQVASLVAGKIAGVAKTAKIIGVAVCDATLKNATDRDFRLALDYILNHFDRDVSNVVVVSMATDFYPDVLYENMYRRFIEYDILLVFPPLVNRDPNALIMQKKRQIESSICVSALSGDFSFIGGAMQNNTDLAMVADKLLVAASRVNTHYFAYQVSADVFLATGVVGGIAAVCLSLGRYTVADLKQAILSLGKVSAQASHKTPILSSYHHFF